jgi:hypothetical protein
MSSFVQLFRGNIDKYSVVKNDFAYKLKSQYLKIDVKEISTHYIRLRVELYGCTGKERYGHVVHHNMRTHCDVIHCYVKCQPEIDWLLKQSKMQHLLFILVGKLAS